MLRTYRRKALFSTVAVSIIGLTIVSITAASAKRTATATRTTSARASKATIRVWDVFYFPKQKGPAGAMGRALLLIDQAYMKKYPNVTVSHIGVSGNDFVTDMRKFTASHTGPDVVTNGGGTFPVTAGFAPGLRPMYDLITPAMKKQMGQYLAGEGIGDAAHYSIPILAGVYTFYYNKSLFKQAGIASTPTTYSDLLTDCSKLKAAGITPIVNGWSGFGGSVPWNFGITNQVLDAKGILDWANRKIGFTDPRILRGAQYVDQMAAQGCFGDRATAATTTDSDGVAAFEGGRGAMLFWSDLDSRAFAASPGGPANFGAFAFPKLPTSAWPAGTPDSGYNANWSLSKYSKNCRAAWNYIQFFVSPPAQKILAEVGHQLPVNNQVKLKVKAPLDAQILKMAANPLGHHGIGATSSGQESSLQQQIFPQLISGTLSPDKFVSQMQDMRNSLPPLPQPGPLPKTTPCN